MKRLLGLLLAAALIVSSCEILQTSKSDETTVVTGRFGISLPGSPAANVGSRSVQQASASYAFFVALTQQSNGQGVSGWYFGGQVVYFDQLSPGAYLVEVDGYNAADFGNPLGTKLFSGSAPVLIVVGQTASVVIQLNANGELTGGLIVDVLLPTTTTTTTTIPAIELPLGASVLIDFNSLGSLADLPNGSQIGTWDSNYIWAWLTNDGINGSKGLQVWGDTPLNPEQATYFWTGSLTGNFTDNLVNITVKFKLSGADANEGFTLLFGPNNGITGPSDSYSAINGYGNAPVLSTTGNQVYNVLPEAGVWQTASFQLPLGTFYEEYSQTNITCKQVRFVVALRGNLNVIVDDIVITGAGGEPVFPTTTTTIPFAGNVIDFNQIAFVGDLSNGGVYGSGNPSLTFPYEGIGGTKAAKLTTFDNASNWFWFHLGDSTLAGQTVNVTIKYKVTSQNASTQYQFAAMPSNSSGMSDESLKQVSSVITNASIGTWATATVNYVNLNSAPPGYNRLQFYVQATGIGTILIDDVVAVIASL